MPSPDWVATRAPEPDGGPPRHADLGSSYVGWMPRASVPVARRGVERTTTAAMLILLRHEIRELLAGRALWAALLLFAPLVGYSFIQAVEGFFGFASRGALQSPELARGLSPLDGIVVPTFGALYLANSFLLPFVAIRAIGHDKQNGTLKLLLQLPVDAARIVMIKGLAIGLGWLLLASAGISAMVIWLGLGGHIAWLELISVVLGHALYALVIVGLAFACAALTESAATAAIAVLAVTLGCWVLDFAARAQTGWIRDLGSLSLTAALRPFEHGLIDTPAAALMLGLGGSLVGIAVVSISAGLKRRDKMLRGAFVVCLVLVAVILARQFPAYQDVTEDRRNSFSPADELALRAMPGELVISARLAPGDSRLREFDREILSKLRRVVPHLRVDYPIQTRTGLPGTPRDDRYGLISYDYQGAHDESRSTSPREVLPLLHALAGRTVTPDPGRPYPGYPLIADATGATVWFYAGLPALLILGWWFSQTEPRRRGVMGLTLTVHDASALAVMPGRKGNVRKQCRSRLIDDTAGAT